MFHLHQQKLSVVPFDLSETSGILTKFPECTNVQETWRDPSSARATWHFLKVAKKILYF